jgi:hypothetical protein
MIEIYRSRSKELHYTFSHRSVTAANRFNVLCYMLINGRFDNETITHTHTHTHTAGYSGIKAPFHWSEESQQRHSGE